MDILKGPWRATKSGASVRPDDGSGTVLAFVNDCGTERLKIAQLMAAAPELRDTLKALRDWCDENLNGVPDGYAQIMEQADAVLGKLVSESTPTAVESASHGESVDVRLTALRSIDDAYLSAVLDWIAGALKRHEAVSESLTAVRLVRHLANLFPRHRESVDGLSLEQRAGRVNG